MQVHGVRLCRALGSHEWAPAVLNLVEVVTMTVAEEFFEGNGRIGQLVNGFDLGFLEHSSDFVVVTNEDLDLIYANDAADQLIEESTAVSVEDLLVQRFASVAREIAIPTAMRDGFWSGFARLKIGKLEVPFSLHITKLSSFGGGLAVIHGRDISGFAKIEQVRMRLALSSSAHA